MAKERKQPGGIALKPTLWERIERVAAAQGKSKNEVMEAVLDLHVPDTRHFGNQRENSHDDEEKIGIG